MYNFRFILRKANASNLSPVSVRYTYGETVFEKGTGVSVLATHFNTSTGKVNEVSNAPELNSQIAGVVSTIETAIRNLTINKITISKEALSSEYDSILAASQQPTLPATVKNIKSHVHFLEMQLASLLAQVQAKQTEIRKEKQKLGISSDLVTHYFAQYAIAKKANAKATLTSYRTTALLISRFNANLTMQQVNVQTLKEFEDWLVADGKRTLSVYDSINKMKSLMYHYKDELELPEKTISAIRSYKLSIKVKRNPNTIYLTQSELNDLIEVPLFNQYYEEVRDRFVLMCLIGVRFRDSFINPAQIINNHFVFTTSKTDDDISIPLSEKALEILERYNYNLPSANLSKFNDALKSICARIPSFNHTISIKSYVDGKNKPVKEDVMKHKKMSAHVARKTFINLALVKGINPVAIAGIVGHSSTNLIMKTYGSKEAGKERITDLLN